MGLLGMAMAGGLENAGGQIVSNSQAALDLQNKQQMAQFQSGLDADREAATMRLQQSIGNENAINAATGPVGTAKRAGVAADTVSAANTFNDPSNGVADAAEAQANLKLVNVAPGDQLTDGKGAVVGENARVTKAESDTSTTNALIHAKGVTDAAAIRAAAGGGKANNFSAKERDDGLTALQGQVDKQYIDPMGKPLPTANSIASNQYQAALNAGADPTSARVSAMDATNRVAAAAKTLMAADPKLDMDSAMAQTVATAQARMAAAQKTAPASAAASPAPAAAPAPAASGLLNKARAPAPEDDTPIPSFTANKSLDAQRASKAARDASSPQVPDAQRLADIQAKFSTTNLRDPRAAQALQDDPAFSLLPRSQQAAVSKAVNGR